MDRVGDKMFGCGVKKAMDELWIAIRKREEQDAAALDAAGLYEPAAHLKATIRGGVCYVCEKPYKIKKIEGGREYYAKDCLCLPTCPICGKDCAEKWLRRGYQNWDRCECGYYFGTDPSNWRCDKKEATQNMYRRIEAAKSGREEEKARKSV